MFPSLTNSSLFVARDTCEEQDNRCPLPLLAHWAIGLGGTTNSAPFLYTSEEPSLEPLNLDGTATYIVDRYNTPTADGNPVIIDWNMTINYPGT